MTQTKIAAAVAAALGLAGASAMATTPTPAQASNPAHSIFMGGSSAAAAGVVTFLESTICGGSWSLFTTPTSSVGLGDFRAVSCTAASGQPFSGTTLTVWYRPEGGSVIGVLPVINNISIKQLDMQNAACIQTGTNGTTATYTCTVGGSAAANGTNDTWGPGVLSHNLDMGVSDLEPGVFGNPGIGGTNAWAGGGNHDPAGGTVYATAFTGPDQGVDALQAMTHSIIFQQTFGFVVSSNLAITDLPREQIAAIYDGLVTDWSKVTSGGNTAVGSGTIVVCNRETGSGTRASADLFLNGTGCNSVGANNALVGVAGSVVGGVTEPADNFQTIAELDCVNSHTNAIGYVSVDNFSKVGVGKSFPSTVSITVSGTAATIANSAVGDYQYVYEASLNKNNHSSGDGGTFFTALGPVLQNVNTTSNSAQITAIPGLSSNAASTPLQTGAPSGVKTSDFTRGASAGGNSCTNYNHG